MSFWIHVTCKKWENIYFYVCNDACFPLKLLFCIAEFAIFVKIRNRGNKKNNTLSLNQQHFFAASEVKTQGQTKGNNVCNMLFHGDIPCVKILYAYVKEQRQSCKSQIHSENIIWYWDQMSMSYRVHGCMRHIVPWWYTHIVWLFER